MKMSYLFFILFLILLSCGDEEPRFCYACTYQYDFEDGSQEISYGYENGCSMMTEERAREFVGYKSNTTDVDTGKKGVRTVTECIKKE